MGFFSGVDDACQSKNGTKNNKISHTFYKSKYVGKNNYIKIKIVMKNDSTLPIPFAKYDFRWIIFL